jgi:hypothetical protein
MNCWHCNEELIWGGDHDYDDVYGAPNHGIITNLSCSNEKCNAFVEVFLPFEEEVDDEEEK